jgi:hypothetical protein
LHHVPAFRHAVDGLLEVDDREGDDAGVLSVDVGEQVARLSHGLDAFAHYDRQDFGRFSGKSSKARESASIGERDTP